jgi:hypothetical protein
MDIISKVKSLKKQHDLKRSQLELSLETTPRDSRYSDQLVEMMRREEYLLANGGSFILASQYIRLYWFSSEYKEIN